MTVQLNPNWPPYDEAQRYLDGNPHYELVSAFEAYGDFSTASFPSEKVNPFTFDDIAEVTEYDIKSHEERWEKPGDYIGSELDMVVVGRLKDGRWFSGKAWNDYTGWGCQDGVDWKVADTYTQLVYDGLDDEDRNRLALPLDPSSPRFGIEG